MSALQQHELLKRLPRTPYPGLRPFLDHEDMLMHGRRTQVTEIVRRLGHGALAGDDQRLPRVLADADHDDAGRTLSLSAHSAMLAAAGVAQPLTRFVAVIGGSGSGKSSLIRAGVVPHLRQFGIAEVGDLWEPVVFTPGTNFSGGDERSAPAADETPITRLAWRLDATLRGGPNAARREAIAELLRRPGGLGRVVDTYGPELNLPEGVDAAKACVLVVIDQFEELFHHSNREVVDARQLIERVIDHFHQARAGNGSPRCFLAITMRSEHLNDCAGFLGLPEAINAGAFLVSRLDDAAVREVIEKPAQRFLRLRQRERRDASAAELPRTVRFDPSVVERLVEDTRKIAHDPDHLPLLQHLLARLWQRALRREQRAVGDVPGELNFHDLCSAALAEETPATLPAHTDNLLRLALERWAEHEFHQHTAAQQMLLADVLRRLVYKDPASGTYNQQRLYVASHPAGADALSALLHGRWIHSVNYLYWDDDNPDRITLKVSHESFIRGWQRLRALADAGALQFTRVLELMTACRDWQARGQAAADLMEDRLLRRMKDAGLAAVFSATAPATTGPAAAAAAQVATAAAAATPGTPGAAPSGWVLPPRDPAEAWREWQAWLPRTPRGPELDGLGFDEVARFFQRSESSLLAASGKERNSLRRQAALATAGLGALALMGLALAFIYGVQGPVIERAALYFESADAANLATLRNAWPEIGGGAHELQELLQAAQQFETARQGLGVSFAGMSDGVLADRYSPGKASALSRVLPLAMRAIEPNVNGKLRAVLTRALWHTDPVMPVGDTARIVDLQGEDPRYRDVCDGLPGVLLPVEGARQNTYPRRGVFVTRDDLGRARVDTRQAPMVDTRNGLMFSATLHANGQCVLGQQIAALPREREPALVFDALMGHVLMATNGDPPGNDGRPATPATVTLLRLQWDNPDLGHSAELSQPLAVVYNDRVAETLRRQAPETIGMAAATWRMPGGRAMRIGGEAWRVVTDGAQRLVPAPAADALDSLAAPQPGDGCATLRDDLARELVDAGESSFRISVHRSDAHCLVLLRGLPVGQGANLRDTVQVRAYALQAVQSHAGQATTPPVPLASLNFGRLPRSATDFRVGRPGTPWDGWLVVVRSPDAHNPLPRLLGVPWSTGALLRLGTEVLQDHRRHAPASAAPGAAATTPPKSP
ncbi:nSTAND1 domain-containing NTPase [Aquabacterium sp. OR-4]|uniref:nSTAND1 domain-containing NTPase n=1 Tax=Aquabacterium sp. OR-4 TaxID=2978127 RepID=UPI0021B46715|nr:hypothetical protein [Aquabacterium sp. OR-4]MDT7835700.1 hypothetical protein [Aquabacterium sp. OR-4]